MDKRFGTNPCKTVNDDRIGFHSERIRIVVVRAGAEVASLGNDDATPEKDRCLVLKDDPISDSNLILTLKIPGRPDFCFRVNVATASDLRAKTTQD